MKIFDCFTFNDENDILEIRLNELNKFVDFFVIIEFGETHSGNKKQSTINKKLLSNYKNKIQYFFINDFGNIKDSWEKENFQRNKINLGLRESNLNDIIMISDVDEIPKLNKFDFNMVNEKIYAFSQTHSMYKLNLVRKEKWIGTKLCLKKNLKSPQWLRSLKVHKKYNFLRLDKIFSKKYYSNFEIINDGGWHFGWLKNVNEIIKKINSYAHLEHNTPEFNDPNYIQNCINQCVSFLDKSDILSIEKDLDKLPEYIFKNQIKFRKWII